MELTKNISKQDEEMLQEYSEDYASLIMLLGQIKIYIGEPRLKRHFDEDKEERNVYTVDVKRGDVKISFHYGDSIDNTKKHNTPRLYDILTCIKSDHRCHDNFKDFCLDFGFDQDSIKVRKLFTRCKKQSEKLHAIFSEEEAEWLPS